MNPTWVTKPLATVSQIRYGYTESASTAPNGPKFLRITDIQEGRVDWRNVPYCEILSDDIPKYDLLDGDIVFARTGATTGKSFLVSKPPKAVFASYLIRLRVLEQELIPEYVALFFESELYWKTIRSGASGSTLGGFNASKLGALPIPIPPKAEQKRIVKVVHSAFAAIANAKEKVETILCDSRDLLLAKVQATFHLGCERRNIANISDNLDGKRIPITKKFREPGPYPYYGASGIVDSVSGFIFDEDLLLVSEDGANLLARTTPIAFSVSGKVWVNNHAHVLRFKQKATQRFVEYYLNSIRLEEYVSGMAQPKLNQGMLNSIQVPYPAVSTQTRMVEELDLLSREVDKLESVQKRKVAALDELKKSLLNRAFSGELTGSEA